MPVIERWSGAVQVRKPEKVVHGASGGDSGWTEVMGLSVCAPYIIGY